MTLVPCKTAVDANPLGLTRLEFSRLVALGYNQVPLIARLPTAGLNPTALVASSPPGDCILLESTRFSEEDGRYSIVVSRSAHTLKAKGMTYVLDGVTGHGNPTVLLGQLLKRWRGFRPESAPMFCGGAIGYLAYECNHYFADLPHHRVDDHAVPDLYFLLVDELVVFDHVTDEVLLIASVDVYDVCLERLRELEEWVARGRAESRTPPRMAVEGRLARYASNMTESEYAASVGRVQDYVSAGDVYQVNMSQRLEVAVASDSLAIYETLSAVNPVHFASFLRLDGFDIVSASPERLVRLEEGRLRTRPIAGTRRRGTPAEDARFVHELLTDEKEVAEHVMLVDLERNDLGRVSTIGSVEVTKMMDVTYYAHVIHVESEVESRLDPGKDFLDVIAATFPGGTITGVPKIRTMEVITELEPNARGVYTGSIGYISFAGEMDLNIVIRTLLIKNGVAYASVGSGVVCDSVPQREYKETLHKARSMLTTLAVHAGAP